MSSRDIIALCQRNIATYPDNCSGFVKAVASGCGVAFAGQANTIVDSLAAGQILMSGKEARQAAVDGKLVIAGHAGKTNGHVAIVVEGPMDSIKGVYPYVFWGLMRTIRNKVTGHVVNVGFTRGHGTLNYAFSADQKDSVIYAAFTPIESLMERAGSGEGYFLETFVWGA